jgi:hypothetical protein
MNKVAWNKMLHRDQHMTSRLRVKFIALQAAFMVKSVVLLMQLARPDSGACLYENLAKALLEPQEISSLLV